MSFQFGYSMAAVQTVFAEEIVATGGTVSDTYADESCLFARSILQWIADVRNDDMVRGGVALKAVGHEVWVHPYVFRQVCRNGAIMAQAIQTEHLERLDYLSVDEACDQIRAAIQSCCVKEAFHVSVRQIRSAQEQEADLVLNLMPMLSRFRSQFSDHVIHQIITRFTHERDTSRFGLMNAITSLARDTRDPDLRWRLEELGGSVPVVRTPRLAPDDAAVELFAMS